MTTRCHSEASSATDEPRGSFIPRRPGQGRDPIRTNPLQHSGVDRRQNKAKRRTHKDSRRAMPGRLAGPRVDETIRSRSADGENPHAHAANKPALSNHTRPKANYFDKEVERRIRYHAQRLCRGAGFGASDRDDIKQELRIDLFNAMPRFDSSRSSRRTFTERVLCWGCGELRRRAMTRRATAKRLTKSLGNTAATSIEGDRRLHMLGYDTAARQNPVKTLDRQEASQAVQAAIATLPNEHLKAVAKILLTSSKADAARTLNVSSSTIYHDCQKIRRHFELAGIGKNLEYRRKSSKQSADTANRADVFLQHPKRRLPWLDVATEGSATDFF